MKLNKYLAGIQIVLIIVIGIVILKSRNKVELNNLEKLDIPIKTSNLFVGMKVDDVIRYGESLWDIFRKHKVNKDDIHPAINEFKKVYDPREIKAGDKYQIVRDSLNQLLAYHYHPEISKTYKIEKDSSGNFICNIESQPLVKKTKTLFGTINTSLYQSIKEQGETPEIIINFSDIFQWDIDFFTEPQKGDSYKLVYETFYLNDHLVRYGKILAAQYTLSGKVMTAFYYDNELGKSGYYDWEGKSFQKTFLKSPLNYRRISSHFSMGRRHPILKRVRPHYGVDFVANRGTPIVAPAAGVVSEVGYQKVGVGRYLKIRHTNSHFVTLYGHLSKYAKGIKKGVAVKQKQTIGYVGSTGLATGPHLHYTFYENGRPINPLRIRNVSADPLKAEQIDGFQRTILPLLSAISQIEDHTFAWRGTQY